MPLMAILILLFACNAKVPESISKTESEEINNEVQLEEETVNLIGLTLGKVVQKKLSGNIQVNGLLDVPPQNMVTIAAPLGGFIKHTNMLQGMMVHQGDEVVVMQHPSYIEMQQEFLEANSQLEYLQLEYQRQQELAAENVNAQKTLQLAKSQYQGMLAKKQALQAKLGLIGLNTEKLTANNMQNSIRIKSPIHGYVTEVNINQGMYVNQTDVLVKIVNTEHLHAELTVFEKDIPHLKIGQTIRFTLGNEAEERLATVYLIGKEISKDRTVRVHGHLSQEDLNLMPGMFLKANIETQTQQVPALPNKAIVQYQGNSYVFVALPKANTYKMVQLKTGLSHNGFTEVVLNAGLTLNTKVVLNGAYDLLAKLKNSEEEE